MLPPAPGFIQGGGTPAELAELASVLASLARLRSGRKDCSAPGFQQTPTAAHVFSFEGHSSWLWQNVGSSSLKVDAVIEVQSRPHVRHAALQTLLRDSFCGWHDLAATEKAARWLGAGMPR